MKIKIRRTSIRLRLSCVELNQLQNYGFVKTEKQIGRNSFEKLKYTLEKGTHKELQIIYALDQVKILIPHFQFQQLIDGEIKRITHSIPGSEKPFKVKIERQFELIRKNRNSTHNILYPTLKPI